MTRTKVEYAKMWLDLGQEAAQRGLELNILGRTMEAERHLLTARYCYQRYTQSITPMATRKTDRTLNILGVIFSIGIAALLVYLITHKR